MVDPVVEHKLSQWLALVKVDSVGPASGHLQIAHGQAVGFVEHKLSIVRFGFLQINTLTCFIAKI